MAKDGSLLFDTKIDDSGFKSGVGKLNSLAKSSAEIIAKSIAAASTAIAGLGAYSLKSSIDFESAFAGVKKTVDATDKELEALRTGILDMSKTLPASASSISAVAEAAGQLGIQTDNILEFTQVMIDLGETTNLTATDAATALARFANIVGMSQSDFDKLGSVVVALGNNMATTESEIVEMAMRLAGAGNQAGMAESDILSLAASLSSVGIEAEAGGSAFSRVMNNMQLAVETGKNGLADFAKVSGMTTEEFSRAFKEDASSALLAFISGLAEAESQGISATKVLDDMGIKEIRMRDALLRAAGASDLFSDALSIGSEAWRENSALSDEAAQRYATTESKIKMLKNSAQVLAITIGDELKFAMLDSIELAGTWVKELEDAFATGGFEGLSSKLGTVLAEAIIELGNYIPGMVELGANMINNLITGLEASAPQIATTAVEALSGLINAVITILPKLISLGASLLINLAKGFAERMPELLSNVLKGLVAIGDLIIANLPMIIQAGLDIIKALAQGIADNLPFVIENAPRLINEFSEAIYSMVPAIIKTAFDIIVTLAKGLVGAIPTLLKSVPQILMAIINVFTLYNWWNLGKGLITRLKDGLLGVKTLVVEAAKNIRTSISETFQYLISGGGLKTIGRNMILALKDGVLGLKDTLVSAAKAIGKGVIDGVESYFKSARTLGDALVKGIWYGISNVTGWVLSKIKGFGESIIGGIKDIFGIKSPSRVMRDQVGAMLAKGVGEGLTDEMGSLNKQVEKEMSGLTDKMQATVESETTIATQNYRVGKNRSLTGKDFKPEDNSDNSTTTITGNTFVIREDADIEKVAAELDKLKKRKRRVAKGVVTT